MLVLDTNAAIAIMKKTPEGLAFIGLIKENEKVIAPQLYLAEITNALRKHVRAGDYTLELAHALQIESVNLVDEFIDMRENCTEALDESMRNDHSLYDMFYLTLARRYGATLFTLDRRLIALCEKLRIDCIHTLSMEESSES